MVALIVFCFSIVGELVDEQYPLKINHLTWLSDNLVLFTSLDVTGSTDCLHLADINGEKKEICVRSSVEIEMYVIGLAVNSQTGTAVLQLMDGSLLKYLQGKFNNTQNSFEKLSDIWSDRFVNEPDRIYVR